MKTGSVYRNCIGLPVQDKDTPMHFAAGFGLRLHLFMIKCLIVSRDLIVPHNVRGIVLPHNVC